MSDLDRIDPPDDDDPDDLDTDALNAHSLNADQPENDDDQKDEPEPGFNYPSLYIDGVQPVLAIDAEPGELERVQLEFDATVNDAQSEADERAPLGWCNSATIHLERDEDAVTVLISVGDPRGAFGFTVRRLPDGRLIMHTPYPGEPMPHMSLTEIRPGTYEIGS